MKRSLSGAGAALIYAVSVVGAVGGCAPALDWRKVRPEGAQATLLFPCKPELAQRGATAGLAQCKAGGFSFALAWAEAPDAAQLGAALLAMRESLAAKLHAAPVPAVPVTVPGMTPNPQALAQRLDGTEQHARVAVFSRGTRVYQLLLLGARRPDDAAWETLLGSVRLQTP